MWAERLRALLRDEQLGPRDLAGILACPLKRAHDLCRGGTKQWTLAELVALADGLDVTLVHLFELAAAGGRQRLAVATVLDPATVVV